MNKLRFLIALLAFLVGSASSQAARAAQADFAVDAFGVYSETADVFNGTFPVTFCLKENEDDDSCLVEQEVEGDFSAGLAHMKLSTDALPETALSSLWLQMTIETPLGIEVLPAVELSKVPWSRWADFCGTATTVVNGGLTSVSYSSSSVGASALDSTGVTAGTYGSATLVPQITVDSDGRITAASNVGVAGGGAGGDITGVTAGAGLTGGGTDGAVTLDMGAGTGITVAADSIAVDQAFSPTWTAAHTFNGTAPATFNHEVVMDFVTNDGDDELLDITHAMSGTAATSSVSVGITNSSTGGIQVGLNIVNEASTGTTDELISTLNNDPDTAVPVGLSVAGLVTTALDLSDPLIGTAIWMGDNDMIVGGVTLSAVELSYVDGVTSNIQTQLNTKGTAPGGATYITQTADATLSAEQALSSLATGYMKVTTGTGVVSSQATPIPVGDGGTGATTFTDGAILFGNAAGAIQASAVMTEGQLLIGDGTTEPAIVAMSGDATMASTGALTIGANVLDFADFENALDLDASTAITADGAEVLSIVNTGTGNSFLVGDEAADATPFVIDPAGQVGIGTTAPAALLEVEANFDGGTILQISNSNATAGATRGILFDYTGGEYAAIHARSATYGGAADTLQIIMNQGAGSKIEFVANAGAAMTIDDTQKVGIGDTSPLAMLTVGAGDLFQVSSGGAVTGVSLNLGTTTILDHISGTATNLVSASIAAASCGTYGTITVTGAAEGDTVYASPDAEPGSGIETANLMWNAVVTAADTVTIRACNPTAGAIDTADTQEWRADVWKH